MTFMFVLWFVFPTLFPVIIFSSCSLSTAIETICHILSTPYIEKTRCFCFNHDDLPLRRLTSIRSSRTKTSTTVRDFLLSPHHSRRRPEK